MSSLGITEAIAAAVIGAGYLTYYSVKGAIALTKGVVKLSAVAGRAAYQAYQANEDRRRAQAMEELNAVQGILGDRARQLHNALAELELNASQTTLDTMNMMNAQWQGISTELDQVNADTQQSLAALQTSLNTHMDTLQANVSQQADQLNTSVSKACLQLSTSFERSINGAYASASAQLQSLAQSLADTNEAYLAAAAKTLADAEALLNVLTHMYVCDTYAPTQLAVARESIKSLRSLVDAGQGEAAHGIAATVERDLQYLQLNAELNTARFQRDKLLVDHAMSALREVLSSTDQLTGDDPLPADLLRFVQEEAGFNMAFWSQGRMPRLQERAARLLERCEHFHYVENAADGGVGEEAASLVHETEQMRAALVQEMLRTRSFIVSRVVCRDLALKTRQAYIDQGWTPIGKPGFVDGDARKDMIMTFRKGANERVVLLHCFYDEAAADYKVQVVRHDEDDTGMPDEAARQAEDAALSQASQALGVPASLTPSCAKSTIGTNTGIADVDSTGVIKP